MACVITAVTQPLSRPRLAHGALTPKGPRFMHRASLSARSRPATMMSGFPFARSLQQQLASNVASSSVTARAVTTTLGEAATQQHAYDLLILLPFLTPACTAIASLGVLQVVALPPLAIMATTLVPALMLYVVGPALDIIVGEQPRLTQEAGDVSHARDLPLLYSLPQLLSTVLACMAAGQLWAAQGQAALLQITALAVCTGIGAAKGIAGAHELIHSRHWLHQAVGGAQLAWCFIWPYLRAHHSHHKTVGLPEDHTTARKGESLYHFYPRYVGGNYSLAWEEEAAEAGRRGRPVWSVHNRMIQGMVLQASMLCGSWLLGGVAGLGLHLAAGSYGLLMLVALDYALHYSLERGNKDDGSALPATVHNSFNSAYLLENCLFWRVFMHSDHHTVASKPYTRLGFSAEVDAPLLAPGCPMMIFSLATFVPPLWFKLADPLGAQANVQHQVAVQLPAGVRGITEVQQVAA